MKDWTPPQQSRFIDPWPIRRLAIRNKLEEGYGERQK